MCSGSAMCYFGSQTVISGVSGDKIEIPQTLVG